MADFRARTLGLLVDYQAAVWAKRDALRETRFEAKLHQQAAKRGYKLVPGGEAVQTTALPTFWQVVPQKGNHQAEL